MISPLRGSVVDNGAASWMLGAEFKPLGWLPLFGLPRLAVPGFAAGPLPPPPPPAQAMRDSERTNPSVCGSGRNILNPPNEAVGFSSQTRFVFVQSFLRSSPLREKREEMTGQKEAGPAP